MSSELRATLRPSVEEQRLMPLDIAGARFIRRSSSSGDVRKGKGKDGDGSDGAYLFIQHHVDSFTGELEA
jgi:hypothetical protein